jgi:TonB family protein
MRLLKASLLLVLISFPTSPRATAQAPLHFEKDGLSFDYPAGWTLVDNSNAELQSVSLRRPGVSTFITVFASRASVTTPEQVTASFKGVTMPYVEKIARGLGLEKPPASDELECIDVAGRKAAGFRMAGRVNGEPAAAEVYTIMLGRRLLHLVRVGNAADEAQGADAWKSLLGTLKVEATPAASPEEENLSTVVTGGVLNGKVLKKPQPVYPLIAKRARQMGVVIVQITVDENGDVESAQAISGPPLLRGASEQAAKLATFSPVKLCGRPVKVTGVVTYNFILY